jgi:hypothetical protein
VSLGLAGLAGVFAAVAAPDIQDVHPLWTEIGVGLWGVSTVPWLLFALQYTGRYTRIRAQTVTLLLLPCLGFVAAIALLVEESTVVAAGVGLLTTLYCLGLVVAGAYLLVRAGYRYGHLQTRQGVSLAPPRWSRFSVSISRQTPSRSYRTSPP